MKIKTVDINNRKKCLEIVTAKGSYSLPFVKLALKPRETDKIKSVFVDKELGSKGITYILESGEEDSIPLDAFLDYNKDPDYLKQTTLYKLTLLAHQAVKKSHLSKREIARKLNTSPAQLYRLLDTANYQKTIDQMFKLLGSLGYRLDVVSSSENAHL